MKKLFLILYALLTTTLILPAQQAETIMLSQPNTERGLPLMKALSQRASQREFDTKNLQLSELSDLLWAANGINRPAEGKRTAPSAMNAQDIDIYLFINTGVYLYNAAKHQLEPVVSGDQRSLFSREAGEPLPAAICLLVSDISRFRAGDEALKRSWAAMDAGIVSQNINIFCASVGLATRPRAGMDQQKIRQLLKLKDTQYPMLNNPVSYLNK